MIYLVISEEYDAEPHATTTYHTVSAQCATEEEADQEAERLRDLCRGRTFQGPITVMPCAEEGRNFVGWLWPLKSNLGHIVKHKDGNPRNNDLDNLEIVPARSHELSQSDREMRQQSPDAFTVEATEAYRQFRAGLDPWPGS